MIRAVTAFDLECCAFGVALVVVQQSSFSLRRPGLTDGLAGRSIFSQSQTNKRTSKAVPELPHSKFRLEAQ